MMTGFEPRTSGVGCNGDINCANTTTAFLGYTCFASWSKSHRYNF